MKIKILKAEDRGHLDYPDFKGYAIFSNGEKNTERPDQFGSVYVFNDDNLYPDSGIGMHPHANVEIVTIMLFGSESHRDTLGIHENYQAGDVQLISGGTGLNHAGGNVSSSENARHLQIWIKPRTVNTPPRVTIRKGSSFAIANDWEELVSPDAAGASLKVNQDAWIFKGIFDKGKEVNFHTKRTGNGLLVYILEGRLDIGTYKAVKYDTLFITDSDLIVMNLQENTSMIIIETVI